MPDGHEWTAKEWNDMVAKLRPSTPDDVSITVDGQRLDTLDKIRAFIDEDNARRRARSLTDGSPHRAR